MKLVLLLPWACCCLCGSALATGFLYPFPAAALQQHGYPEQGAGSPGNGYSSRRGVTPVAGPGGTMVGSRDSGGSEEP